MHLSSHLSGFVQFLKVSYRLEGSWHQLRRSQTYWEIMNRIQFFVTPVWKNTILGLLSSKSTFLRHEVSIMNKQWQIFFFFKSGIGLPARLPVSFPSLPFYLMWEKSALWNSRSKQATHPPPPILSRLFLQTACSSCAALLWGRHYSQVVLLCPPRAAVWAPLLSLLASPPSAILDILHLRWVSLPFKLFPTRLLLLRVHQTGSIFLAAAA